jgi:hypothetical protein
MKKLIASAFLLGIGLAALPVAAHADPITCPPGQAAVLNPSLGGWVCVNAADNENKSEDPVGDKPKGYFDH